MSKVKILNTSIDNLSTAELLDKLQHGVVFTPNVDHIVKLQHDRDFFAAYNQADYLTCDSKILYFASRLLGSPLKEKISGSDLFPAFYHHHRDNEGIQIFLLGGRPGVAAGAQAQINAKLGRSMIIGSHSPSFGFENDEAECDQIIDLVNQSGATVLAIGVGAPKQEKFIHKYRHRFRHIKIFLAVGATLDFEAGTVRRSPRWVSEVGLEWLYRLVSEPKRLWRRYLWDGPAFFWWLLLQLVDLYTDPFNGGDDESTDLSPHSRQSPAMTKPIDL